MGIYDHLPVLLFSTLSLAIRQQFSMDPFKKQAKLIPEDGLLLFGDGETYKLLVTFLKSMISNKFSAYLTRAAGEIVIRDCVDDNDMNGVQAALSFILSVVAVLELDSKVENEVQALKRTLLSPSGVAEYKVRWENPCPICLFTMGLQTLREIPITPMLLNSV
ncbi:hypothetical protein ACA910_003188 [Epithemia clementina (nom. ined.)]